MITTEISDFFKLISTIEGRVLNINDLLCEAVKSSSTNVVEYLIRKGGDINCNEGELLSFAIEWKNYPMIEYIITNPEFTVTSSIVNIVMKTLLDNNTELFYWFLKQKKYIGEQYLREIVKHTISMFVNQKDFDTLQFLYDALGPFNYICDDAVINAVNGDFYDILEFLYKKGANVRLNNDFALILACTRGHFLSAQYLLSIGADINNYIFILSLSSGNIELVKLLLNHGADATCNDEEAMTIAQAQFNLPLIEILLRHGCTGKNITWQTARKYIDIKTKKPKINKINSWWIPFSVDVKECGKRMMEKSWNKISEMYDDFLSS